MTDTYYRLKVVENGVDNYFGYPEGNAEVWYFVENNMNPHKFTSRLAAFDSILANAPWKHTCFAGTTADERLQKIIVERVVEIKETEDLSIPELPTNQEVADFRASKGDDELKNRLLVGEYSPEGHDFAFSHRLAAMGWRVD